MFCGGYSIRDLKRLLCVNRKCECHSAAWLVIISYCQCTLPVRGCISVQVSLGRKSVHELLNMNILHFSVSNLVWLHVVNKVHCCMYTVCKMVCGVHVRNSVNGVQ